MGFAQVPDSPPPSEGLVIETILRVIGRADRWQTVELALHALQNTLRMAEDMEAERQRLTTASVNAAFPAGAAK